jgi:2,5-diamino-6-(ribosylamino)-4(3H)-pyrimidinone 5'-phosphate reductase
MCKRPVTTLFLLASVDGKISTGATNYFDFDQDLPTLPGVREGLQQYYDIEQTTDIWSFNSGAVMAKIGANTNSFPEKTDVNFVVVDNTHLTSRGVEWLSHKANNLVIITQNDRHPATWLELENVDVIQQDIYNFRQAFEELYFFYGCEAITIQTGGTINSMLLRQGLIDYINIVVAPILIGGNDTPTLIDGPSVSSLCDLRTLELLESKVLDNSYIQLTYKVNN